MMEKFNRPNFIIKFYHSEREKFLWDFVPSYSAPPHRYYRWYLRIRFFYFGFNFYFNENYFRKDKP